MTTPDHPHTNAGVPAEPVHFLDGLRCIWCAALNATWLWANRYTVECGECGRISLTSLEDAGEDA